MEKYAYFCSRFQSEITKRYIFVLRMEMSEPSIRCKASRYDGSRVCVDFILHLFTGYLRQPPFEEVVYCTTLLIINKHSTGCGSAKMKNNGKAKQNHPTNRGPIYRNVHAIVNLLHSNNNRSPIYNKIKWRSWSRF